MLALIADNAAGLYLLNVAAVVTVLAGLGLLVARILVGRPAPLRHGLLLATLILLLLSPFLIAASLRWDLGLLGLADRAPTWAAVLSPTATGPEATSAGGVSEAALVLASQALRWCGPVVLTIWSIGAAWRAVVLVRGFWLVHHLRRSLRPASDPRWFPLAETASRAVGLRRPARIAVSDWLSSPVSLGIFRPVIVVPASLEGTLNEPEIEGILLHEAAHVARGDHLAGLLERLARIAFWWNPLVRALCAALDDAQEELCDNHVVRAQGSGVPFAHCLVKVAEWTLHSQAFPTVAGLLGRRSLAQRLTNLLRREPDAATWLTPGMALPLAVFVLAAGGLIVAGTVKPAVGPPQPGAPALPAFSTAREMTPALPPRNPAVTTIPAIPLVPARSAVSPDANEPSGHPGPTSIAAIAAIKTTPATAVGER
jgi:beta-lactamase regulating signal transducer with metallopeptidase domain